MDLANCCLHWGAFWLALYQGWWLPFLSCFGSCFTLLIYMSILGEKSALFPLLMDLFLCVEMVLYHNSLPKRKSEHSMHYFLSDWKLSLLSTLTDSYNYLWRPPYAHICPSFIHSFIHTRRLEKCRPCDEHFLTSSSSPITPSLQVGFKNLPLGFQFSKNWIHTHYHAWPSDLESSLKSASPFLFLLTILQSLPLQI